MTKKLRCIAIINLDEVMLELLQQAEVYEALDNRSTDSDTLVDLLNDFTSMLSILEQMIQNINILDKAGVDKAQLIDFYLRQEAIRNE